MNRTGPKPRPFECREDLFWYLVGLIATDGCLVAGKAVVITSSAPAFLERLRGMLGGVGRIQQKRSGSGSIGYDYYVGGVALYRRLLAIGLTPRKSLTLGVLDIPDVAHKDFFRGVIDGDGNIRRWIHPTNGREQWAIRIYGGSKPFLQWIQETTKRLWHVEGGLHEEQPREPRHHMQYILKYGKIAAKVILTECYYPGAFALQRKQAIASACIAASVGWSRSHTVTDVRRWQGWTYSHAHPGDASGASRIADGHIVSLSEYVCDGTANDGPGWRNVDSGPLKGPAHLGVPVRVRLPALEIPKKI